jgi:hypothetical protein
MLVEVIRHRVAAADVERVLELRGPALAELRSLVPELRQADLVRVGEDVWLDIRIWGKDVAPVATPLYDELVGLLGPPLSAERGERVHTTGTAWAAGR